ncbi:hypothetical protein ACJ8LE_01850 [Bifidobacterium breve]|uniref:hypothetical protein n=1 Tax=Bifidobacterium breve TaxID=1685 RepID=UPI003B9A4054
MMTMVKIMVDGNTMRKARRVKAWFNIKNMDNAVALVQYYPDYNYDDFKQLFEQYYIYDVDNEINKLLCPNPGLTKIPIQNPKNIP